MLDVLKNRGILKNFRC